MPVRQSNCLFFFFPLNLYYIQCSTCSFHVPIAKLPCPEKYPSWMHGNADPKYLFKLELDFLTQLAKQCGKIWDFGWPVRTSFWTTTFSLWLQLFTLIHWNEKKKIWGTDIRKSKWRKTLPSFSEHGQKDIVTCLELDIQGPILYRLHPMLLLPCKGNVNHYSVQA